MGKIFPKLKPQLSEIRGLHASGLDAPLVKFALLLIDMNFTGQADLQRQRRSRKNTRVFILDIFFLHNVKNEDLTLWLFDPLAVLSIIRMVFIRDRFLNKQSAIEGIYILGNGYHCDITVFYITSLLWSYVVRKYIQCPFFLVR